MVSGAPLIPAVMPLTAECRDELIKDPTHGALFQKAWEEIAEETKHLLGRTDIEAILSRIRQKRDALLATALHGLTPDQFEEMQTKICAYIAKRVAPAEASIPDDLPHDRFASWIKSFSRKRAVEIFTLNYDILIERSLEKLRIPLFDGFVGSYRPYFDAAVFDRDNAEIAKSWIRLWKMHGSINWHLDSSGDVKSTYRGEVSDAGEMILPSHYKYDESRKMPYRAMQDRLGRVLDIQGGALVTCGYSFGDEHINETILSHSDRSNATIFALMYGEPAADSPVMRLSENRRNFVVIGPKGGRYKGIADKWSDDSITACSGDATFQRILKSGEAELDAGNFSSFTQFLTELSVDDLQGIK